MSLSLPMDQSIRETFEVRDLIDWRKLPTRRNAVAALRNTVQQPGVRSAHAVCLRADGIIVLLRCGKRGGITEIWRFGDPVF